MSKQHTTDTDQASEDDLRMKIYSTLKSCYGDGEPGEEAILALIRTEKLKLLAEVRERVIGEDELLEPWNGDTPEAFERNTYTLKRNRLRTEQNAELTKLEAEL